MSTITSYTHRAKSLANCIELSVFKTKIYKDSGGYVNVQGTDFKTYQTPVLNIGYSFNLKDNTNAEVLLLSDTMDVNHKLAIMTIPRDKTHHWKENTGGIQSPVDKDRVFEFNSKRSHIRDNSIAFGNAGAIEIDGNNVYIRGNLYVEGDLNVNGVINCKKDINALDSIRSNADMVCHGLYCEYYIDKTLAYELVDVDFNIPDFEDYDA